jgi:hypothetical protein
VRKHADATLVRVRAVREDGRIVITVTDNGRGFEQEDAFDRGLGLQGMRERARLIGGELLVISELSGGTSVEVRAPLIATSLPDLSETEIVQGLAEAEPPPPPVECAPPPRASLPIPGDPVVRSESVFTSMPVPPEAPGLAPGVQTERP